MNILKSSMKHLLVGLLFIGFSAFKPTLSTHNHQYEKPELETLPSIFQSPEIIELEAKQFIEILPTKNKKPLPEWKVIVDDVVVMLHDKSENMDDLAMSNYIETRSSKYPFPG